MSTRLRRNKRRRRGKLTSVPTLGTSRALQYWPKAAGDRAHKSRGEPLLSEVLRLRVVNHSTHHRCNRMRM